jgi:hypothetical protein
MLAFTVNDDKRLAILALLKDAYRSCAMRRDCIEIYLSFLMAICRDTILH